MDKLALLQQGLATQPGGGMTSQPAVEDLEQLLASSRSAMPPSDKMATTPDQMLQRLISDLMPSAEPRMYGIKETVKSKTVKSNLREDPNQTSRPRIEMAPAVAEPVSKGKKVRASKPARKARTEAQMKPQTKPQIKPQVKPSPRENLADSIFRGMK